MLRRWAAVWFTLASIASIGLVALIAALFVGDSDPAGSSRGGVPESGTQAAEPVTLTVDEVLAAGDDLPAATVTVVGTFDALVEGEGPPTALVLESRSDESGVLVVPESGAVPPEVLEAGGGTRIAATGQIRIASATNPPPGGGELRAEFLGEPVLEAQRIAGAGR